MMHPNWLRRSERGAKSFTLTAQQTSPFSSRTMAGLSFGINLAFESAARQRKREEVRTKGDKNHNRERNSER